MPYSDPEQQREFNRKWIAERRRSFLAGKSCEVCGSTERLEVDHIDPEKKVSHRVWSWSEEKRAKELAKCQVLCHEHHQQKTTAQAPRGEASSNAKLTEEQVQLIRADPRTQRVIAAEYGIGQTTVGEVKRKVCWKHVT